MKVTQQTPQQKICYWIKALEEDCESAKQALFFKKNPQKSLKDLIAPFRDSVKNLTGIIETEL